MSTTDRPTIEEEAFRRPSPMPSIEDLVRERWIRIPSRGREHNSGLSRSFLYQLINQGVVRSACIRKPGRVRGVRLVSLDSLMLFIEKHIDSPEAI